MNNKDVIKKTRRETTKLPLVIRRMTIQQLLDYSANQNALARYYKEETPSPVQHYSLTAGVQSGNAESRPTEQISFRILADPYHEQLVRSITAVGTVLSKCDSVDLKLLKLCYLNADKISIESAADRVHIHPATAARRINSRLEQIAKLLGWIPAENGPKPSGEKYV